MLGIGNEARGPVNQEAERAAITEVHNLAEFLS